LPGSGRLKQQDYDFLGGAYLLSTCLHETYRDLIIKSAKAAFSRREHDILCWGAEGKTNEEISMILNISANTVRFHWKNIFKKTGGERPDLRDHKGASPAHHHARLDARPLPEAVVYGAASIRA